MSSLFHDLKEGLEEAIAYEQGPEIRRATNDDTHILAEMAVKLWHSHTIDELETQFADLLSSEKTAFFIKYVGNVPVGFAQCSLRNDYVEGTASSPVGYLEGIFVHKEYRGNGFARELLLNYEKWAKDAGCVEFASDCELDNTISLNFHTAMGFIEANRIICFKKDI